MAATPLGLGRVPGRRSPHISTFLCLPSPSYILLSSLSSPFPIPSSLSVRIRRSASDRAKARPKPPEDLTSPDDIPRGVVPPGPEEEQENGERVPASDPISIRGNENHMCVLEYMILHLHIQVGLFCGCVGVET